MAEAEYAKTDDAFNIARRWCELQGSGWAVGEKLGTGGTAPVFEVTTPTGIRALKIYDEAFCSGDRGLLERERLQLQLKLQGHDCPSLVQVYAGGEFDGRLYVLMSRASGQEL